MNAIIILGATLGGGGFDGDLVQPGDAQSASTRQVVHYLKQGGILGERSRLIVLDDGRLFARQERGGRVLEGRDRLHVLELESLRRAVETELLRPRVQLWDCGLYTDEVRHDLSGTVDGARAALTTCNPDAHLVRLFDRLEALIRRAVNPDLHAFGYDAISTSRDEWMRFELRLGQLERRELRVFPRRWGPARYVLLEVDADGSSTVRARGELSAQTLRRLRVLCEHLLDCGGYEVHDHTFPWPVGLDAGLEGPVGKSDARSRRPVGEDEAGSGPARQGLNVSWQGADQPTRRAHFGSFEDPVARAFLGVLMN